ncbi:hypothetical protein Nocox_07190 [Nonomuraea coxensis DSM 45129]|uniref:Uncharacterized protein n=1 Tax=Nonomuraea coxensis DSM 45129 TaxID=1122611 RepID=A0ABX8TUL8_9ACTN|nr:hypothetical protein [Nonomuraea coxensis]QYC39063.1 hypothetical protein Nocox_07190 [Nonomuraea coxensis DSM 45129]
MKAIRHHAYGGPDVLELEDVPAPEPGDEDVLIRVRAAAVGPGEWHLMPAFRPGDEVFGCAGGAFAEYVTVRHDGLRPR